MLTQDAIVGESLGHGICGLVSLDTIEVTPGLPTKIALLKKSTHCKVKSGLKL